MRGNSFGEVFTITTSGESHGPSIDAIVDGVPAGISLDVDDIQRDLDRRRPGQNEFTTPRKEADAVQIRSGLYRGETTGAPISLSIPNTNTRSEDYSEIDQKYRPGHADVTYDMKYGRRDPNGGGRSSYRVMSVAVAAGAIAKKITDARFTAFVDQIGPVSASILGTPTSEEIEASPIRCPDKSASKHMQAIISEAAKTGNSIGGCIQFVIDNVEAGLGEPIFNKLDAKLSMVMMLINATMGVEIGSGFRTAQMRGTDYNDAILAKNDQRIATRTNNAGGIQGGISTGMPITGRVAFHPTSSVEAEQETVDSNGKPTTISVKGRHDPCVLPRAVPAVEAMAALVIADFTLLRRLDLAKR